jgi:lipoprotein-anchoring transpeptidase ErfK/SrfK
MVSTALRIVFYCLVTISLRAAEVGALTATPSPEASATPAQAAVAIRVVVSIPDQKMAVLVNSKLYKSFRISTSRYGEGDNLGSWRTPLGHLVVANKIGGLAPVGAVFNGRHPTGEILSVNAPGRDPIISRIIWLRGMEYGNRNAYQRCIYIHGTPQEEFLGKKSSFGCVRMRSEDVIQLFQWIQIGTDVIIVDEPLNRAIKDWGDQGLVAKSGKLGEKAETVR